MDNGSCGINDKDAVVIPLLYTISLDKIYVPIKIDALISQFLRFV